MLSDEEREAIEYLKSRLYGNEGCKFIDVAQSDLRIFLNLEENLQKDIENWEKYCDEQENDITLKNNKICDLEFKIEKQSKEIEEYKKQLDLDYVDKHFVPIERYNQLEKEIEELNKSDASKEQSSMDYYNLYKELVDKIKAKIEEVEQWELYNMKIPRLSTLDERLGAKIGIKYVLQSLLEKE